MKKILTICLLATAVMAFTASCGRKGSTPSSEEADKQRSELYEAMNAGDIARVELIADSLSLMTDDLSTDETVAVLLAFLQVHNDAATRKDSRHDLITIRKFVDVYDIALGHHGNDLVDAFNAARELNGNVNLPEIAQQLRERLNDYDASMGDESAALDYEPAPKAETADSTAQKAEQPVTPLD